MEHNDPIERLLKLAGSRPQPSAERKAEFKRRLHDEWHRVTAPSPRRRTVAWTAAAAAAAAAVLVMAWLPFWRSNRPEPARAVLGRIARIEGAVRVSTDAGATATRPLVVGDDIRADMLVETTSGRVAIALADAVSLRVDAGSRLAMVREGVLKLDHGAVYVDSRAGTSRPVLIETPNGHVRDVGTQFEVRTDRATLRVHVREGEVIVDRRGRALSARAGEALRIDQSGAYERSAVPVAGPLWEWAAGVAPPFELEGRTVQEFLDWVGREQGWRWRFDSPETARRAAGIVTHGSIEGYTPEEALAIVLPTCGLSFVRKGNEFVVSLERESSARGR